MNNFITQSKHQPIITARVIRANGDTVNLGRINGILPVRAWFFRLKHFFKR